MKQKIVDKGHKAELLFNNKVLQEAFETVEQNIIHKWKETKFEHKDAREILFTQLRCLENIKAFLKLAITRGKRAEKELQDDIDKSTGENK